MKEVHVVLSKSVRTGAHDFATVSITLLGFSCKGLLNHRTQPQDRGLHLHVDVPYQHQK